MKTPYYSCLKGPFRSLPFCPPVVETREGIFELLAARSLGQPSKTGTVPVDLPVGQDDAILLLLCQGGHDLWLAQVFLCNEH